MATALQAQHYLVSTLLNSTNSFQTLLDSNLLHWTPLVFNTTPIQQAPVQHTLHSTHLAFNNFCIQQYLIMDSTLPNFNNHGFNNPCFQQTWIPESLFLTLLVPTILFFNITNISSCKKNTRGHIFYNGTVEHLRAVGTGPYYQAVGCTLSKKTPDRPKAPIVAASGKQGCTL